MPVIFSPEQTGFKPRGTVQLEIYAPKPESPDPYMKYLRARILLIGLNGKRQEYDRFDFGTKEDFLRVAKAEAEFLGWPLYINGVEAKGHGH